MPDRRDTFFRACLKSPCVRYQCNAILHSSLLTHWGRVTHIFVGTNTNIGSDNGLPPDRRQAIIWPNGGILLIWLLGINFSEISIDIYTFSFKKIHFKMSSGKWRPCCRSLNVLNPYATLLFYGNICDICLATYSNSWQKNIQTLVKTGPLFSELTCGSFY